MIMFAEMLLGACEKAVIKFPENVDNYSPEEFPHFHFMCCTQLNRPMVHGEHWENAEIIAKLSVEEMKTMTLEDCIRIGIIQKI